MALHGGVSICKIIAEPVFAQALRKRCVWESHTTHDHVYRVDGFRYRYNRYNFLFISHILVVIFSVALFNDIYYRFFFFFFLHEYRVLMYYKMSWIRQEKPV